MAYAKNSGISILHLEKDAYPQESLSQLETLAKVEYFDPENQLDLIDKLSNVQYDAIFTKLGLNIDYQILSCQPSLKTIVTPTTGLDHISEEIKNNKSINIISLKGEVDFLKSVKSTAEHTWALLLSLVRNVTNTFEDVKGGRWRRSQFKAYELNKKKLGIIGYGRLGKMIANYARAFNMKILAYDIKNNAFTDKDLSIKVELDFLLKNSDIITLHIPSDIANRNFLDQDKISKIKENAILINTSRGEVIDESELLKALNNKHLMGAALDVLSGDSIWDSYSPVSHPLIKYSCENDNLIITPHCGGYSIDSIRSTRIFITNLFIKHLFG